MSIVSEIWTWQQGARVYSRMTTNVCARRFLARLQRLGLLSMIVSVHAYFGDRAEGGNGYGVEWKDSVDWNCLQEKLPKL